MTKYLLAGAAAFALMSGVAFAQSSTSTQSTTTTNGAPVNEGYSISKTQKTIDSNGNEINKSRAYESNAGGTNATSSTRTNAADGSQTTTSHEEQSSVPAGETRTDTTTINR